MKRFWHAWLAVVAVTTVAGSANAQWNQSAEIGSYQSILARTGYNQNQAANHLNSVPGALPGQLAVGTMQGTVSQSGGAITSAPQAIPMASGCNGNGAVYGSVPGGCAGDNSFGVAQGVGPQAMNGGQVNSGVAFGQSSCGDNGTIGGVVGGPVYSAPAYGSSTLMSGTADSYIDYGAGSSANACGAPVYQPGAKFGLGRAARSGGKVNRVGSIFGLVMRRNYEDAVRLGGNAGGTEVFSTDIDQGNMSGLGASLISRGANGNGWEAVYWGIDDDIDYTFTDLDFTSIGGLADINHVPSGFNVFQIFNADDNSRIYRDTEINNVEFNLLRNGGNYTTRRCKQANFELLAGFRMFQFNESFRYVANGSGVYPGSTEYRLEAENFLLGAQLGGRNEVCLGKKLRFASAVSLGIFNNHVETRQRIFDETGYTAVVAGGPAAGRDFDYSGEEDDIAMLGQIDLGLIYQLSCKIRARVGYRAMGVSGVALAVDQIPSNFEDPGLLNYPRTNGSLLMHGVYFGAEACF